MALKRADLVESSQKEVQRALKNAGCGHDAWITDVYNLKHAAIDADGERVTRAIRQYIVTCRWDEHGFEWQAERSLLDQVGRDKLARFDTVWRGE